MAEPTADIDRARDAVRRQAWAEAYERLSALDAGGLGAPDLESLADAAWWLSRSDESRAIRQRAHAAYVAAGDDPRAAWCAARIGIEHFLRQEPAAGTGWLMRAQRQLGDHPESVQHGFVAVSTGAVAHRRGDLDEALRLAERATGIGRRFGDPDLVAMGIHLEGLVLCSANRIAEGMALLDEVMTAVVAGELSPYFTGIIYCDVLSMCLDLGDVARAGEWNQAAAAWCASLPPGAPFPAICRVNRAEAANLRGAWPEAAAEALRASEELTFHPMAAAGAFYQTGEIRRRTGNLAGAEEAFLRAHELGLDPQPGLALLRLAQGRADAALAALRLALTGESGSRPRRARLLTAQVEVALAAGDAATAKAASAELDEIASEFGIPALDAAAAAARGALDLAGGDAAAAVEQLRHACGVWRELGLPYELAQARMLYAQAVRAAGDEDGAGLELRAALAEFERLGATGDAARAARLLGRRELPRGLTEREAGVLRLVAAGRTNREIATELVISEHTVARHLQNIFAKLGVPSRAAATAFAVEHGLS